MFGQHFYNRTIRKTLAVFGTLFNDIHVGRLDENGNLANQQRVPLAYAPRQKFLERLRERPDLDEDRVGLKLPRISFEALAPVYDPERQMNALQTQRTGKTKVWSPAPYRVPISLMFISRNEEEALQILEQIIPYFKPSLGVKIRPIEGQSAITDEITFVLQSINKEDTFEGEFIGNQRTIIYTLEFDALINIYSRIDTNQSVIKTAIIEFHDSDTNQRFKTMTTAVNPTEAEEDGVYTIDVSILDELERLP